VAPGYRADLVVLGDLRGFAVQQVWHGGKKVAEGGALLEPIGRKDAGGALSSVHLPPDLGAKLGAYPASGRARVIGVDGAQIVTRKEEGDLSAAGVGGIQFAAVVERHRGSGNVGLGLVRGFGMTSGALASTVSHDSHNLVIVGVSPREMEVAASAVAQMGGGLAVVRDGKVKASCPLPVAGLMSQGSAADVARALDGLHAAARECGCSLPAPFMTLAFIALPVIPSLKLTDKGLVDVDAFAPVPLLLEK
jgi:adenine deaminase